VNEQLAVFAAFASLDLDNKFSGVAKDTLGRSSTLAFSGHG
jgi:hypothetical protein